MLFVNKTCYAITGRFASYPSGPYRVVNKTNRPFVFKGTDDDSTKMSKIIDTAFQEIHDSMIALQFDENSEGHNLMKAIYPVKSIPSIHLISSDGKEIGQLNGVIEKAELVKTINEALAKQQTLRSNANPQHSPAASQQQVNSPAASQQETANSQASSEVGSLKRANDSPVSQKDKEQHAQELIKELRVKKAKEEEALALEREKDRIRTGKTLAKRHRFVLDFVGKSFSKLIPNSTHLLQTGKEIQTAKEKQQQKEMEEAIKQREREKQENKRAREAVLAQIKQDQEDRKARFGQIQDVKPKPLVISQPTQATSDETRIQLRYVCKLDRISSLASNTQPIKLTKRLFFFFRLPDSSNLRNVFKITDPLRSVMRFIEDKTSLRSFKLQTNFPKQEFTDADLDKTLVDLKLFPSAVLIVREPNRQNAYMNDFH